MLMIRITERVPVYTVEPNGVGVVSTKGLICVTVNIVLLS